VIVRGTWRDYVHAVGAVRSETAAERAAVLAGIARTDVAVTEINESAFAVLDHGVYTSAMKIEPPELPASVVPLPVSTVSVPDVNAAACTS
jgi:hypothetical protein